MCIHSIVMWTENSGEENNKNRRTICIAEYKTKKLKIIDRKNGM